MWPSPPIYLGGERAIKPHGSGIVKSLRDTSDGRDETPGDMLARSRVRGAKKERSSEKNPRLPTSQPNARLPLTAVATTCCGDPAQLAAFLLIRVAQFGSAAASGNSGESAAEGRAVATCCGRSVFFWDGRQRKRNREEAGPREPLALAHPLALASVPFRFFSNCGVSEVPFLGLQHCRNGADSRPGRHASP